MNYLFIRSIFNQNYLCRNYTVFANRVLGHMEYNIASEELEILVKVRLCIRYLFNSNYQFVEIHVYCIFRKQINCVY